jgi:hypothetical protein
MWGILLFVGIGMTLLGFILDRKCKDICYCGGCHMRDSR